MKSPKDIRHKARMRLVELLYARLLNPETLTPTQNVYKYDTSLYEKIYQSVQDHKDSIDELIEVKSKRKLEEIKNIEHAVLQVTFAESYFEHFTPYKVAIDEAIELTREYSDEASATFISGVLGATYDDTFKQTNK